MQTLLDSTCQQRVVARLRTLSPDTQAQWGRLTAPKMIAHLGDQLRHVLGDITLTPRRSPLRWPVVRTAMMFWLPWPKGKIQSVPEMFITSPTDFAADLATLEQLLRRLLDASPRTGWPDHAFFGPMTRDEWGRFSYRHFDHHLRQFGA